jgi:uncharacterized protein (DUF983 family)
MSNEYKKELKNARPKQTDLTCPLCGAKVTYRGFTDVECAGEDCRNYDGETKPAPVAAPVDEADEYGIYLPRWRDVWTP